MGFEVWTVLEGSDEMGGANGRRVVALVNVGAEKRDHILSMAS